MADSNSATSMDPKSGFCSKTKTYYSLRPPAPFPPPTASISVIDYIFSLQTTTTSPESMAALIDSSTGETITYRELRNQIETLASSLQTQFNLSKGDTAFILFPAIPQIHILYLSLLSIGVIISPSNPSASTSEISHQISLCKPVIAFATSSTTHKLPSLGFPRILLDSPGFISMANSISNNDFSKVQVKQLDPAMVLFSSGTTGRMKGVVLTHRNLTSYLAGIYLNQPKKTSSSPAVILCTVPCFHVYGIMVAMKAMAMRETLVMMERFELGRMMRAVEEFKVTIVAVAPPVVVAMTKRDFGVGSYDLSSLEVVHCGGAPLGVEVIGRFKKRFPNVIISQGYGLTETCAGIFSTVGPEESRRYGSTGKLASNCEAKIVDPDTGHSMPPFKQGELWIRGPMVMKGYVGDKEATMSSLDSDGWLRSGDLCYIDDEGFLYVVDRLKEMIKYKGFQVPPAELENLLQSHPDIVDAAVIPYPNEEAGQVPMAFVVKRPQSSLDESQVMDFVAKQVAPYKKIRRVAFIDSIPKNAPGKILRKELTKLALSGLPSKL